MNQISTSKPASKRPAPTNFLDALRELERDVTNEAKVQVQKIFTEDLPEAIGFSKQGTLKPNESFSPNEKPKAATKPEGQMDSALFSRLRQMQEQDMRMRQSESARIRQEIKAIQDEVKMLAKSAGQLSQEIEIATFQATVNPGKYHKNFFAHLRSLLVGLRKKVNASQYWLSEHNGRASKRGYYWGQVQQSGTKYMLSSERYMVTSTG